MNLRKEAKFLREKTRKKKHVMVKLLQKRREKKHIMVKLLEKSARSSKSIQRRYIFECFGEQERCNTKLRNIIA